MEILCTCVIVAFFAGVFAGMMFVACGSCRADMTQKESDRVDALIAKATKSRGCAIVLMKDGVTLDVAPLADYE